ncbi:MAG: radical SAM protein [Chloracidobacterium sp. CP2_5A]|nr:MAG: radical SAM protein [Chloracidobacterium sp. CP2_5A]
MSSRSSSALVRRYREARMIIRGVFDRWHPVLAHLVPIRRCNLACAYCNEYDAVSPPVPLNELLGRIDKLAALGSSIVAFSGGEPMLHPDLYAMIRRIRAHGMMAGLITNGYYLTPERIAKLNEAGLEYLQISIDNVNPDEVSQKSLKVLDRRLTDLARHARFAVSINSVIGGGIRHPADAVTVAKRAAALGFAVSCGIIHDGQGALKPLSAAELRAYEEVKRIGKTGYSMIHTFQDNLAHGRPNAWKCRAGARYLYICEDGLVHYCSQQRGYPGIPLASYTKEDLRREYAAPKPCAPFCTIACVHRASTIDFWRDPQDQRAPATVQT